MLSVEQFLNDRLVHGRAYFSRDEASAALDLKPEALAATRTRLVKKRGLANPRHGFYLILRPEGPSNTVPFKENSKCAPRLP